MNGVRLRADRDVCIGSGLCVVTDEQVFDQDDDGIVLLLNEEPTDSRTVRDAVANCPSGALRLEQS